MATIILSFEQIISRAKWYDSDCDSKQAMASFVQAVEEFNPDVIIGPPCSAGKLFSRYKKTFNILKLSTFSLYSITHLFSLLNLTYLVYPKLQNPNTSTRSSFFFSNINFLLLFVERSQYNNLRLLNTFDFDY